MDGTSGSSKNDQTRTLMTDGTLCVKQRGSVSPTLSIDSWHHSSSPFILPEFHSNPTPSPRVLDLELWTFTSNSAPTKDIQHI